MAISDRILIRRFYVCVLPARFLRSRSCTPRMDFKTVCRDRTFVFGIMNTKTGLPVFTVIYNQAGK